MKLIQVQSLYYGLQYICAHNPNFKNKSLSPVINLYGELWTGNFLKLNEYLEIISYGSGSHSGIRETANSPSNLVGSMPIFDLLNQMNSVEYQWRVAMEKGDNEAVIFNEMMNLCQKPGWTSSLESSLFNPKCLSNTSLDLPLLILPDEVDVVSFWDLNKI